ncbi:hypothetical protein V8C26DRAFT_402295 [Trichoderma gracile]
MDATATNATSARDARRGPGDREAPLKYAITMRPDQPEQITFYQRLENELRWLEIPPDATFERKTWDVGLAINHHGTTDTLNSATFGVATHWGVFICPVPADNEEHPYRIFGLNFRDAARQEFILGQKWQTADREFRTRVDRSDFDTKEEYNMRVVCSLEEFILTAQMVLQTFQTSDRVSMGGISRGGYAYSLFFNNCQNFALALLKEIKDSGWESRHQSWNSRFKLADLASTLLRSREDLRNRFLDYEGDLRTRGGDDESFTRWARGY